MAHVAFEHVGLEQRVVRDAPQGDAVVGEHVLVEFDVLAELPVRFALEPRPQDRERRLDAELRRRSGVVVRERHIGRAARG